MITLRRLYRGSDDELEAIQKEYESDKIKQLTRSLETVSFTIPNASSSEPTTETRVSDPKASSSNPATVTATNSNNIPRIINTYPRSRSRERDRSRSRERERSRSRESNEFDTSLRLPPLISSHNESPTNLEDLHTITRPTTLRPFPVRPSPQRLRNPFGVITDE